MVEKDFSDFNLYKNRELSWLQFEERILNEAKEQDNRLLERVKFLSITGSNLDEFFMIRVASLKVLLNEGFEGTDIAGMSVPDQLSSISDVAHKFMDDQYDVLLQKIIPDLKENGIRLCLSEDELSDEEKKEAENYYRKNVFPILTPLTVDSTRPFPLLRNGYLYVGGYIKKGDKGEVLALVQVPNGIGRLVPVAKGDGESTFILLEELIKCKFNKLFSGYEVGKLCTFRVLRNADLFIKEEDNLDLLNEIEKQVKERQSGEAIRLEISGLHNKEMLDTLKHELNLSKEEVYETLGPINLSFLMEIYDLKGYEKLHRPEYTPVMPWEFDSKRSLFDQIEEHDLMLIHPFESFTPVIDFITEASKDKDVLAIKQTLYRVSGNSPIVKALISAAENGKQVTVMVELKARFDEENNIGWARMLERAGCQVIYGFANLKTHCKITLVVKRCGDGTKSFVHLGTGNYNDTTAKLYTDISFFTARKEFGEDAVNLFNTLSGYSEVDEWKKLYLAPQRLRNKFVELIDREAEHAKNHEPSHIIAKVNSLCDGEIIKALYRASCAGVKIDLIVRGICCLRAGVPGVSENITVRSIVGNFLEHSRIFYFKNGGDMEYYCSSADWMPRNMDKRIEILFPVERGRLREKLNHVLKLMLKDNQKAWFLQPDGTYERMPDEHSLYSFQEGFCVEEKELDKDRK